MTVDRIAANDSPATAAEGARHDGRGGRWIVPVLALAAYALAFAQRPGELVADTKIDLHVDPVGFLADAAAAWAPSGGLGQVQAGQYAGYLWPMGPFHALGDLIGLAPWAVHRLWLGTLLAIAAWGTVRLLDALLEDGRRRGAAQLVAGALMIANPYVVVFANRTSITLLAYALLPWLMLAVRSGLREPRGWRFPAAVALLIASLGGGVNAAVAAWVLIGPALLILYERWLGAAGWADVGRFLARALPLTALASAWWIAPVLVQVASGVDFLPFTEPAGAIWTPTSMSESLRLMGFWVVYLGIGYGPQLVPAFDSAPTLLGSAPLIVASLAIPGLAIAGFAWTRRWRYGPFFAVLALVGLAVMFTGFPDGAPLRRALHWSYDRVELVRFLRTAYKAGPLLALALACLSGAAAAVAWERLRGRALAMGATAAVAVVLAVAWSLPLWQGEAVDGRVAFDAVPAGWTDAAAVVDRDMPAGTRALVLPGQVFPFYRWGFTQDAILPALADRPVAVRGVVPYADLRAVDLLWTTDALVQQQRVLPGQLAPLIDLMGVGAVVTGSDDERELSGAVAPRAAAEQLAVGAGLPAGPVDGFRARSRRLAGSRNPAEAGTGLPAGPVDGFHARSRRLAGSPKPAPPAEAGGGGGGSLRFGEVVVHPWSGPGMVRVQPLRGPVVVDGAAATLAGLAALGGLDGGRAVLYAADLDARGVRRAARSGGEIVIGDSNRRRVTVPSQPLENEGPTLAAGAEIPPDGAVLDPFGIGADAQTVAIYDGVAAVRAPSSPSFVQLPEHRPYAALDGDPSTWWTAERNFDFDRRWIEIEFERPTDVPYVELLPAREALTDVVAVEVAGRHHAVRAGWNRLPVGLRDVERLRVRIAAVDGPPRGRTRGPGSIAELRIPGVEVRERLRPPVLAERALAGADLRHATLAYVFERTTGHDPRRRRPVDPDSLSVPSGRSQSHALVRAAGDGERSLARRVELPAARAWRADGWVSVAPGDRAAIARRFGTPAGGLDVPCGVLAATVASRAGAGGGRGPESVAAGTTAATAGAAGRQALALRPVGTVADVRAGRPLRARPCGPAVALPAGEATVTTAEGPLRVDLLRLRSAAPAPLPAPAAPGRVLDPGDDRRGSRSGVRLALDAPAWLVLGEGYNRGWRAECDGRDLGAPTPVDGYANGWRAPAGCRSVGFAFAPQRLMDAGFAVSAVACLALLALLAATALRRRGPRRSPAVASGTRPRRRAGVGMRPSAGATLARAPRLSGRAALALGAAAGLAGAFLFALRAGVVIGPAVALLLWRGVGPGALALAAGALTAVALPAIYLIFPADRVEGFNSEYASDLTGAHWVAVAAWVLLALAVSRASRPHRAAGPADGGGASAPP